MDQSPAFLRSSEGTWACPSAAQETSYEGPGARFHLDTISASLQGTKQQIAGVLVECDALQRALDTEQRCHQETLREITVAWNELNAVLDREERKIAQLVTERNELRATLRNQESTPASAEGQDFAAVAEERDKIAAALHQCEAAITHGEVERNALVESLEKEKSAAEATVKERDVTIARLEAEREELLKSREQHTSKSKDTARMTLIAQAEAAKAKAARLEADRSRLSLAVIGLQKDMAGKQSAFEILQKVVSDQNKTIEKDGKRRRELESSVAVAEILKTQMSSEVKRLQEDCAKLTSELEIAREENTAKTAELNEVRKQFESEKVAFEAAQARLLLEQEAVEALQTRTTKMEETVQTASILEREPQFLKPIEERDRHTQSDREALDTLAKEREARLKVEEERNAMAVELHEAKVALAKFTDAIDQNASLEFHSIEGSRAAPYLLPTFTAPKKEHFKQVVFGPGSCANQPGPSPRTPVKSLSRFGSPAKAVGDQIPS